MPWKPRTRAAANRLAEQHVLAAALDTAAPALVAGDVDHRREVPVDARAGRLERRDLRRAARKSGSKLATSASGTGKMVRWPWMMSAAKISGIFSRDSLTAAFCMIRAMRAPLPLKTPVSWPCRASSSCCGKLLLLGGLSAAAAPPPQADAIRLSWPAFSSSVIREMRCVDEGRDRHAAAACRSARAGLASQATAAPAPISAALREMRVSSMFSPLPLALWLAFRATAGSESLTQCVTGYMTEPTGNCNRSDRWHLSHIAADKERMPDATIRDVARRAQVSVASVSRVLNRLDNVSEETRARVADAVRELGYVPHAGARSLSLARTNAIGVVLPDLHGEFFSEIVRGMDREASRRGYMLLLSNVHAGSEQSANAMRAMRGRVDGLIVLAPHLTEEELASAHSLRHAGGPDQHARRCRRPSWRSARQCRGRARGRRTSRRTRSASAWCTSPARRGTSTPRNAQRRSRRR